MKNVNTIHEQVTANREQWFQYRRSMEANLATLETLYAAQYDEESPLYHSTPAQTVAAYVEAVGYEAAVEIIASLVNRSAWDGRISRRSAEWANAQENSWDEEACSSLSLYTNRIHMAHLEQIAAAMMKYQPTTEEPAEEAQEPAEEAQEPAEEAQEEEQEDNRMNALEKMKQDLTTRKDRSAWDKGVTVYALELLEGLEEAIDGGYFAPDDIAAPKVLEKGLLNGASSWNEYSWGGCSLIYDGDIAERLCCPSELKKTRHGERRPNSREEWLDVQARALYQACNRVKRAARAALA